MDDLIGYFIKKLKKKALLGSQNRS